MFLWMFIEGIILYHMTTVAYSRGPEHQNLFYVVGWGKSLVHFLNQFSGKLSYDESTSSLML